MIKFFIAAFAFASMPALAAKDRKPASDEIRCVVVARNGDNIKFEASNEKVDEYLSTEKKTYGGFVFKYMEGHGQRRLAAYKGRKLYAATFSSRALDLNLDAASVQVGCNFEE